MSTRTGPYTSQNAVGLSLATTHARTHTQCTKCPNYSTHVIRGIDAHLFAGATAHHHISPSARVHILRFMAALIELPATPTTTITTP